MSGSSSTNYGVTQFGPDYDVISSGSGSRDLNTSNATTVCEPLVMFDSAPYKAVAAISAFIGLISLLCSLVVALVIICTKKYRVLHQRLTLHLALASMAHSVVYIIARGDYHSNERDLTPGYCRFIGFVELYASWVELLSIASITFNLILLCAYKRDVDKLHMLHIFVAYLSPLLWCWIPFLSGTFGVRGPWCGIRVHTSNSSTCEVFLTGIYMRFALWQIPLYVIFLPYFILSSVIVGFKLKQQVQHWDGPCFDPETARRRHKIFREIKPLLLFPIVYLVLKLPLLTSQLYEAARPLKPVIALWVLEATISPLAGAVIAIVYGLDPQTRTKLRRCQLKSLFISWCDACIRKQQRTPKVAAYNIEKHEVYGDSVESEAARIRARYLRHTGASEAQTVL